MSRRRPPTPPAAAPDATEDGSDPRRFHDRRGLHRAPALPAGRPAGRKARQLARQVHLALSTQFAGSADGVLQSCVVESVTPAPNAGRLLVRVTGPADADAALRRAAGWLRAGVAASVTRRLVPELVFVVG